MEDGSLVITGLFSHLSISCTPTPSPLLQQETQKTSPLSTSLSSLTALSDALQNLFAVLVQLELGDDNLRGVDGDRDALAVGLLTDDTLNVNAPLETVDGGDLSFTSLVGAAHNGDLVVLADGDGANL